MGLRHVAPTVHSTVLHSFLIMRVLWERSG